MIKVSATKGSNVYEADPQKLINAGVIQEANRFFFHPLGLCLQACSKGIHISVTDEPGGFCFEDLSEENLDKAANVFRIRDTFKDERIALWGSPIQPLPKLTQNPEDQDNKEDTDA